MRGIRSMATVLAFGAVTISGALAEDAPRPTHQTRDKATVACCNPAATNKAAVRPPGVYVGMPLRPGDIGYKKENK